MDIEVESSGSWRMRDAAQNLLERGRDTSDTVMPLSASFDVDTCLARLRRDKAAVVRGAFGAAAHSVLKAVKKEGADAGNEITHQASIPPLVTQFQQLQDMRVNRMA